MGDRFKFWLRRALISIALNPLLFNSVGPLQRWLSARLPLAQWMNTGWSAVSRIVARNFVATASSGLLELNGRWM